MSRKPENMSFFVREAQIMVEVSAPAFARDFGRVRVQLVPLCS